MIFPYRIPLGKGKTRIELNSKNFRFLKVVWNPRHQFFTVYIETPDKERDSHFVTVIIVATGADSDHVKDCHYIDSV